MTEMICLKICSRMPERSFFNRNIAKCYFDEIALCCCCFKRHVFIAMYKKETIKIGADCYPFKSSYRSHCANRKSPMTIVAKWKRKKLMFVFLFSCWRKNAHKKAAIDKIKNFRILVVMCPSN